MSSRLLSDASPRANPIPRRRDVTVTLTGHAAAPMRLDTRAGRAAQHWPRCSLRLEGGVPMEAGEALGMDEQRASETRTGARPLTHGETEAPRRARVTLVRRPRRECLRLAFRARFPRSSVSRQAMRGFRVARKAGGVDCICPLPSFLRCAKATVSSDEDGVCGLPGLLVVSQWVLAAEGSAVASAAARSAGSPTRARAGPGPQRAKTRIPTPRAGQRCDRERAGPAGDECEHIGRDRDVWQVHLFRLRRISCYRAAMAAPSGPAERLRSSTGKVWRGTTRTPA